MVMPGARLMGAGVLAAAMTLLSAGSAPADPNWRPDRPGDHHGRPDRRGVTVEPYIVITRPPRPNTDDPQLIMAEVQTCAASGILLFVDCLRGNHGSIMIRKLEACLQSETIPENLAEVRPCLPPPAIR